MRRTVEVLMKRIKTLFVAVFLMVYTDLRAMWKSLELVHDIVHGDYSKVIPGHDPLVFNRERYP